MNADRQPAGPGGDEAAWTDKANRMARDARARAMRLAKAAAGMGAVRAPRAGEPIPESLRGDGSRTPDALDLPAGVHPVGGRPAAMPDLLLPGEALPVGMQGRAAVDAILDAAIEAGMPKFSGGYVFWVPEVPDAAAVFKLPINGDTGPAFVDCYLTGHTRDAIRGEMVEAALAAARSSHRAVYKVGHLIDEDRYARWDELVARGPRTEGLREALQAAAAADTEGADGEHIGRWFQRTAGRVTEAAYDAGAPLTITGTATRPSGFQVLWGATPPSLLRTDPSYKPGCGFSADLHAYEPREFVHNVIDAVLYGNFIDEHTDEHARLSRELWAAAVARFTPVPSVPPAN